MDDDTIYRQAAIAHAISGLTRELEGEKWIRVSEVRESLQTMPSAQTDIKQTAKLLSDFIESCAGGESYLITPDGETLRTDWGYATEGIQLIHDWAERKSDG